MNQGMFGHPGGMSSGGTRSIIQYGSQIQVTSETTSTLVGLSRGIRVSGAAATSTVRTRLYAAIGKGACKFFAVDHASGTTQSVTVDLVVDGVTIASKAVSIATSPSSALVVGTYTPSPVLTFSTDYVPFNTSFEVYVTNATSSTTFNYVYNVDAHQ